LGIFLGCGDRDRARAAVVRLGADSGRGTVGTKTLCKILPTMFCTQPCSRKYSKACVKLFLSQMSRTIPMSRPTTRLLHDLYAGRASFKVHPHSKQYMKQATVPLRCLPCRQWIKMDSPNKTATNVILTACSMRCHREPPSCHRRLFRNNHCRMHRAFHA